MENNINNLSPLTLAFLGDAVYGLLARKYNVSKVEVFRRVTLGVEFLIEKMAK